MIECIPTPDSIDACLNCGTQNYQRVDGVYTPTDVRIFRFKVSTPTQRQSWGMSLCAGCLAEACVRAEDALQAPFPYREAI